MPKDDLSRKNLDNVSLSGSDMEQSDLSKSSLRRANLKGTNLRDANLSGSTLRDAQLQDAELAGADLRDADLSGAELTGVDLRRAAKTEGLILTGATGLPDEAAALAHRAGNGSRTDAGADKADVLARIEAERAAWDSLFAGLPPAWIGLPNAIGAWSVKDVIAHLSGWRQPLLDDLQAAVQGTPPPPSGWPFSPEEIGSGAAEDPVRVQAVNDWLYERNANRTTDQVLAEAALQWTLLRELVSLMPERLLTDSGAFPKLGGQSLAAAIVGGALFSHFHDEHETGIRAWHARMHGRPAAG